MKKVVAVLLTLTFCVATAFAFDRDDSIVRWNSIVGVITAPGVDNQVGAIHSGAGPWSVHSGHVYVNLTTGNTFFTVEGLVLNGGTSSGTPGRVNSITGTLVCNPGSASPTVLDTAPLSLSEHGNAQFAGQISGIPATCDTPLFLLRAGGRWIASGSQRFISDEGQ
jgi:hypothetical protein